MVMVPFRCCRRSEKRREEKREEGIENRPRELKAGGLDERCWN